MARETRQERAQRARRIARNLYAAHPDARIALDFRNPFELICATVLSAQCTDERVNQVTPALFRRFPDPAALAKASTEAIERLIKPTGFYRAKAKSLSGLSQALVAEHRGKVPRTMEELVELPGVGRKTANVVLGNAYDTPGLVVDTHVARVSQRLALTTNDDPVKIEEDLTALVPREEWTQFSHAMIFHGRRICVARKPRCEECPLLEDCPFGQRVLRSLVAERSGGSRSRERSPAPAGSSQRVRRGTQRGTLRK